MQQKTIILFIFLLMWNPIWGWNWWPLPMAETDTARDTILYLGQVQTLASSGKQAPYLLHANRNGDISNAPYSGNLMLGIRKDATRPNRWFDYDFGVVATGRLQSHGKTATGYFNLLYAHTRLYIVDITAGIKPQYFGDAEEELSMGSLLFSNNAHPVPRISIGVDQWTAFPGLFGYLEFKGGITHGWLADNNDYVKNTLLHHKYIGGRIGGKLPVNISYVFHHAAQWGGYSYAQGNLGKGLKDYWNILLARSGGNTFDDQYNRQGNHIGSQILTLTIKGNDWHINCYWQYFNEDPPMHFMGVQPNCKDGLWGVYFTQSRWPFISAFTLEFANTTDQSGPFHDRDGLVFGGADNYFCNHVYGQGWTYYDRTIGIPIITQDNNRIMAGYIGIKGDIYGFRYRIAGQYTRNWGRYASPLSTHNTALLLDVSKHIEKAWGLDFGLQLAADFGTQWGNQVGALISIRKQGLIGSWR